MINKLKNKEVLRESIVVEDNLKFSQVSNILEKY